MASPGCNELADCASVARAPASSSRTGNSQVAILGVTREHQSFLRGIPIEWGILARRQREGLNGIARRVTCHVFRHSYATHLVGAQCSLRLIQQLMGHRDIRTTLVCLHVMSTERAGVRSPGNQLE